MSDEEKKVDDLAGTVQRPKRRRKKKRVNPEQATETDVTISEENLTENQSDDGIVEDKNTEAREEEAKPIEAEAESNAEQEDEVTSETDVAESESEAMEDGAEEPEKKRKKRRKKKKKVEQEDPEDLEESGDPWADDDDSDLLDDGTEHRKGRGLKIFLITMAAIFGTIAVVYLGFAIYFVNHFYFFTTVNDMNFSLRSEKFVSSYMKDQVAGYELSIKEKGDVTETISGSDIDLKYVENDDIKNAIKSQNPFLWPRALWEKSSAEVTVDVDYNKDKLQAKLDQLKAVTAPDQTDPVSAYPKYEKGSYVIEPEVTGTKVDTQRLAEEANKYISGYKGTLDMVEDACYLLPKYTAESAEVKSACDTLNSYVKAEITYDMSPNTEVVNADLISTWLVCDDAMQVSLNTDSVTAYIADLEARYATVGKTRSITTPTGKVAEVSGGTYGWSIDEDVERDALIANIQAGEVITKQPVYVQTAATHDAADWGSTYCEVDISNQHMWYIVDGSIAMESDVVTGANYDNRSTPTGVYSILEKLSPTVLKGSIDPSTGKPKYETPVDYWMRVTWSGIGFHDATWQAAFGGSRYVNGYGSHGCINMPYSAAQNLYSMLQYDTPVIIHY